MAVCVLMLLLSVVVVAVVGFPLSLPPSLLAFSYFDPKRRNRTTNCTAVFMACNIGTAFHARSQIKAHDPCMDSEIENIKGRLP